MKENIALSSRNWDLIAEGDSAWRLRIEGFFDERIAEEAVGALHELLCELEGCIHDCPSRIDINTDDEYILENIRGELRRFRLIEDSPGQYLLREL